MGRKKKNNVPRCEICGAEATQYVLGTDLMVCDNIVCHGEMVHAIKEAVERVQREEEWEGGRYV
jgi:NAD-dependent SIR2 family protein deacetylase